MAALQAPKKIPAFQRLRSFFFLRNTADGIGLFWVQRNMWYEILNPDAPPA
jgi:hypothetical protein